MMEEPKLRRPHVPWCTIFLVVASLSAHSAVLYGNLITAKAMAEVGESTTGWSKVGLGMSKALTSDVDHMMNQISDMLVGALGHITGVQASMDKLISTAGNHTEKAVQTHAAALVQLQAQNAAASGNISLKFLIPSVIKMVHTEMEVVNQELQQLLHQLLSILRPVLDKIASWITQFGDIIQAGMTQFTQSLDKAQKVFDQVMAQLSSSDKAKAKEEMLDEVFNLVDIQSDGKITLQDLKDAGMIYSVSALHGDKPDVIFPKYDKQNRGYLSREELGLLVEDKTIPGVMTTILRAYALQLTQIAGNIRSVTERDLLAGAVVNLIAALLPKDPIKALWMAQAMGNNTFPMLMTASVMAQLCINNNVSSTSTLDIGAMFLRMEYLLNPRYIADALDLMSNTSFWFTQGFDPDVQPTCMRVVTEWINQARWGIQIQKKARPKGGFHALNPNTTENDTENDTEHNTGSTGASASASLLEVEVDEVEVEVDAFDPEVLEAMPAHAHRLALLAVTEHRAERHSARASQREALFSTRTSQFLLHNLLQGVAASDGPSERVTRLLHKGENASQAALNWASWVAANATRDALKYQELCFKYSTSSSNVLDSFATQLMGMAKKIKTFISLMETYASPAGIHKIENSVSNFIDHGMHDLFLSVEQAVDHLITEMVPTIEASANAAIHQVTGGIADTAGNAVSSPLGQAIAEPISKIMSDMLGSSNESSSGLPIGKQVGDAIGKGMSETIHDLVGHELEDLIDGLINSALGADEGLSSDTQASLLNVKSTLGVLHVQEGGTRVHTGAFGDLADLLRTLSNLFPTVVNTLKLAQGEVSKAVASMSNVFTIFENTGSGIFSMASMIFELIAWGYFSFAAPLSVILLFYSLWASGFFGGPQAIPGFDEEIEPPKTWTDKLRTVVCCVSCCFGREAPEQEALLKEEEPKSWKEFALELPWKILAKLYDIYCCTCNCLGRCHDAQLCVWSFVVLLQIISLVFFLLTIVFALLAGVKMFINAGCSQIYILGDPTVCTDGIQNIKNFLVSFHVMDPSEDLQGVCNDHKLLTCNLLAEQVMISAALTVGGGFLAFVLSIQMIIESASLHEQARYRRMAAEMYALEDLKQSKASAASSE